MYWASSTISYGRNKMLNRREFAVLSIAAGVLSGTGFSSRAQAQTPPMSMPGMPGMAQGMTREGCIDICLKTHRMCLETVRYCTEQGGRHVVATHLSLLLDCAEMCQTTANFLLRSSPQHGVICDACARVCESCARDCSTFSGDARMERCAETCRECARDCRGMAAMKL